MVVSKRYTLGGRESVSHADRVLDLHSPISKRTLPNWDNGRSDLSAVKLFSAQVVQLPRRDLRSDSRARDLVCLLDESGPDFRLCFFTQLIVFDTEVYTTLDGLVEDGHSVRRQYHHALEVFQLPQEDRDQGVVLEVVLCTGFEEDVCFVEE